MEVLSITASTANGFHFRRLTYPPLLPSCAVYCTAVLCAAVGAVCALMGGPTTRRVAVQSGAVWRLNSKAETLTVASNGQIRGDEEGMGRQRRVEALQTSPWRGPKAEGTDSAQPRPCRAAAPPLPPLPSRVPSVSLTRLCMRPVPLPRCRSLGICPSQPRRSSHFIVHHLPPRNVPLHLLALDPHSLPLLSSLSILPLSPSTIVSTSAPHSPSLPTSDPLSSSPCPTSPLPSPSSPLPQRHSPDSLSLLLSPPLPFSSLSSLPPCQCVRSCTSRVVSAVTRSAPSSGR